jgi:hypothetical protein
MLNFTRFDHIRYYVKHQDSKLSYTFSFPLSTFPQSSYNSRRKAIETTDTDSMTEPTQETENPSPLWQKIALIAGGTAFAIVLMFLILMLFPNILSEDRLARDEAGTSLDVTFRMSDGDYFVHQQGRIRPPEEDVILGQYTLTWDEDGFRVPAMQAENYPIAVFGDSFVEGTTVGTPWVDALATILAVPVRNYGYRGYGPNEIAVTAEEFAGKEARTWLLYAHFSGNDLGNANRSLREDLIGRDPFNRIQWLANQAQGIAGSNIVTNANGQYDYPMPMIIGGSFYEIAFLEDLLWWQIAPEEGFLDNKTMDVVENALDIVANSVSEDTCRALIFIPTKEQIYYPYIHEDVRQWIRGIARMTVIEADGEIGLIDKAMAEEDEADFISRLGEQRDAMRQVAKEQGWMFIDLLEPFQQAALERGLAGEELLYYQYDGHWTASGHQLAAEIIADFMQSRSEDCPLTFE